MPNRKHPNWLHQVRLFLLAFCLIAFMPLEINGQTGGSKPAVKHDLEFWQQIIKNEFAVPENENVVQLANELGVLFGSTDPVLRDEIAYRIITNWIYTKKLFNTEELAAFVSNWSGNLPKGIGEKDTDSVLLRSFSALNLATIAALDNQKKDLLNEEQFANLLACAIEMLDSEKDLRGWTSERGWIHSTAHNADLLKFLARSRFLKPAEQRTIIEAIAKRLSTTGGYIFVHDEDSRLSASMMSILNRDDFESSTFDEFLKILDESTSGGNEFNGEQFAGQQNKKNFLRSLYFQLAAKPETDEIAAAIRKTLFKRLAR